MFSGSGSGYNVLFNSVNMNTNQGTPQTTAAMFVNSTFATAGAIDARNNIFANNETTGTRYGVYSLAAPTVFTAIDYNDYFAQNVGFIGGAARPTLADWQAGTGQDANSLAVDPLFIAPTNLHLGCGSPLLGMGTSIAGITQDIDGQTRQSPPDIGGDEAFGPTASAVSRKLHAGTPYDVPLPGVEPRSDGSGNHQVVFTFASPVTFTGAVASGGTVGSTSGSGTNTITVNLTGVANATNVTVTLQCATDGATSGDVVKTMGVLQGDTNGSGSVTASDIGQVKSQSGAPVTAANFRSDLNANGSINSTDVAIVKSRSGTVLPP